MALSLMSDGLGSGAKGKLRIMLYMLGVCVFLKIRMLPYIREFYTREE
jgi:hypothetical protein